MSVTDLYYE